MEPRPRAYPRSSDDLEWPVAGSVVLPIAVVPQLDFADLFESRRSVRRLTRPPLARVASAIAFATRSRFVRDTESAPRYRRLSPSAGALHPFRVVMSTSAGAFRSWLIDADAQMLHRLDVKSALSATLSREQIRELAPEALGFAITLIGNEGLLKAHYSEHESLFWRDAGALMQTLLLSFEAFGLHSCMLGVSGAELVKALGLKAPARAGGIIVVGC